MNHTHITLISKKKHPIRVANYHPNVLYKLISKIIANKIKILLPLLISESHSAFVSKRQVADNILFLYKIFHFLRIKNKRKRNFISVKFDMSKAYDRVE